MSVQLMNSNLVRNGNFAQRELYWSVIATAPGQVDFSRKICVITGPGRVEQSIAVTDTTTYIFSLYTLITYNGAGSARLVWQPSGTTETITLVGNHAWIHHVRTISAPAGTTALTLQLVGDAGDVWFDSVRLEEDDGVVIPVELIRNGNFAENSDEWSVNEPVGSSVTFNLNECQLNLGGAIEQQVVVTPGQTYAFSIDARTPTGGHGFAIFDLAPDNAPEIELRGGGDWDNYTLSLTIPEEITEFTLRVVGVTFLEVDNLSLKSAAARRTNPRLSTPRSHHPHVYSPAQEKSIMTTATAQKTARKKAHAKYFDGMIGKEPFKADFVTHTLKDNNWLLQGTQKAEDSADRTVVVFKYLQDREKLPSGRYELEENIEESRFAVIIMYLSDTHEPAYTAEKGSVEFFHNEDTNHINGALDVTYTNAKGAEVHVQIIFSE